MASWVVIAAISALSLGVLAVILLPFVAALMHITYTLDPAVVTTIVGALVGVVTVVIANSKKNGSNGQ
jgi:hypothetical protein